MKFLALLKKRVIYFVFYKRAKAVKYIAEILIRKHWFLSTYICRNTALVLVVEVQCF